MNDDSIAIPGLIPEYPEMELHEISEVSCGALSVVVDFIELLDRSENEAAAFEMITKLKDLLVVMTKDGERLDALKRSLTNQMPPTEGVEKIERIRDYAKDLGTEIIMSCPDGRERSLALTRLEETVMWAVKSIVLMP